LTDHNRDYEYGIDSWGNEDPDQLQDASEFGGIDDYDIDRAMDRVWEEEEEGALADLQREEEEAEEAEAESILWQKWNEFTPEAYGPNATRSWGDWSRGEDEIVLYLWHGKAIEEIAEKLGRTLRSVRLRINFLAIEASGINPTHRDGCTDWMSEGLRSERWASDSATEFLMAQYIEPLHWKFFSLPSRGSNFFDDLSAFLIEFSENLCPGTVAKVWAQASLLPPVDLDLVAYNSRVENPVKYKQGTWSSEEISRLEWALNTLISLNRIVKELNRPPLEIIRQLNVLGLVTIEDLDHLLFEIRMFE
jgi:hypothetical protein